jgi:hypothetical protein
VERADRGAFIDTRAPYDNPGLQAGECWKVLLKPLRSARSESERDDARGRETGAVLNVRLLETRRAASVALDVQSRETNPIAGGFLFGVCAGFPLQEGQSWSRQNWKAL